MLEPPNRLRGTRQGDVCRYDADAVKEVVHRLANNGGGRVVTTSASVGFLHLGFSYAWVAHAKAAGIRERLLIAEDTVSHAQLNRLDPGHVVSFTAGSRSATQSSNESMDTRALAFQSSGYKHLVSKRASILYRLLSLNVDVLWLDTDAFVLSSPWASIPFQSQCDIHVQSDSGCRFTRDLQGKCTHLPAFPGVQVQRTCFRYLSVSLSRVFVLSQVHISLPIPILVACREKKISASTTEASLCCVQVSCTSNPTRKPCISSTNGMKSCKHGARVVTRR